MNLAVLKRSRRPPEVGDVFAMLPPDRLFLFGRVISNDANAGGFPGSILIYVYRRRSASKDQVPELHRDELLVPPMMTNRRPWTMGYFEFLFKGGLGVQDRLRQHCFLDPLRKRYFDHKGKELISPIEPVGIWGLHSFRTIDDEISKALGIPVSPD